MSRAMVAFKNGANGGGEGIREAGGMFELTRRPGESHRSCSETRSSGSRAGRSGKILYIPREFRSVLKVDGNDGGLV